MLQRYDDYSPEEQGIWQFLFKRQSKFLLERASKEFFNGLNFLADVLTPNEIPRINKVSLALFEHNGWSIEIVDKLLPADEFFFFLSRKKWLCYAKIRQHGHLNFTNEPDIFHDLFGHIPLLINPYYANFLQKIGQIGYQSKNDPLILTQLRRLLCYTVDYGFVNEDGKNKIYGAGILSSYRELNCALNKRNKILSYDFRKIVYADFNIDKLQKFYCSVGSLEQLMEVLTDYRNFMIEPGLIKLDGGFDFTPWLIG